MSQSYANRVNTAVSAFAVYCVLTLVVIVFFTLSAVYQVGSLTALSWHMMMPLILQALLISFIFTAACFVRRSLFFRDIATVCLVSVACAMCWIVLNDLPSKKHDAALDLVMLQHTVASSLHNNNLDFKSS